MSKMTIESLWAEVLKLQTRLGLRELTGDVNAGPGRGSQAATISNNAVTFAKMQDIATDTLIGRDTAGTGDPESISVSGGVEFTGSGGLRRSALTGDVTASAGSNATTIANDAVANAKLADMAQATIKGRASGAGTGDPTDLSAAQVKEIVALEACVGITIDGGGSVISTGVKGYVQVPFPITITAARLFADQSGSIVIDVWNDTYANFPPTDPDSITASAPPTLSSAQKSEDTTLSGWTTSIAAGDVLGFNVDSVATVQRVTLQLMGVRT